MDDPISLFDPAAEWLETDGLGGYAMGTTSLLRRRRYHAVLCAAGGDPARRTVLVGGFDALLSCGDRVHALSAQQYGSGTVSPRGDAAVRAFAREPWPSWEFWFDDGVRVRMELLQPRFRAATVLVCTLLAPPLDGAAVRLELRPLLAMRDHHRLRRQDDGLAVQETAGDDQVVWRGGDHVVAARGNGQWRGDAHWYRDFLYAEERARGYDATEDLYAPGVFRFDLRAAPAMLAFAAGDAAPQPDAVVTAERTRRAGLSPMVRAAEQYLVRRGDGLSLIAGYPWFADWGRDTFLSLRGLLLATGRREDARAVLFEWLRHLDGGMLPNRFPDQGSGPIEYHTADAALWFAIAAHEFATGGDVAVADRAAIRAAILAIVERYRHGTRHGIAMDADGLLRAGEPGVQVTWMDAIVDGRVVTPRVGKPVELQALWINALAIAAALDPAWRQLQQRALASFRARFWNEARGCLFDVVDADHVRRRVEDQVRPNQILAVGGLPHALLDGERARSVVAVVQHSLLTPLGLRSLAPDDPDYRGRCEGTPRERDLAYHNGTVWPWLLGPFVDAWVRVHGDSAAVRLAAEQQFVRPLLRHLESAGLGHVSEIADGSAPHTPRGCPFQAWSLAELLRLQARLRRETVPSTPPRRAVGATADTAITTTHRAEAHQ